MKRAQKGEPIEKDPVDSFFLCSFSHRQLPQLLFLVAALLVPAALYSLYGAWPSLLVVDRQAERRIGWSNLR